MMGASTLVLVAAGIALLCVVSCAVDSPEEDGAAVFIAEMDARPRDEQVPNWPHIRSLMMRRPPRVGTPAPDFALETRDGSEMIRLSDFRGKQPVVLIFGSWT